MSQNKPTHVQPGVSPLLCTCSLLTEDTTEGYIELRERDSGVKSTYGGDVGCSLDHLHVSESFHLQRRKKVEVTISFILHSSSDTFFLCTTNGTGGDTPTPAASNLHQRAISLAKKKSNNNAGV